MWLDIESEKLTLEQNIQLLIMVNSEAFWPRLPLYLVWLFGLVVAWRKRQQHPKTCRLASLALVLLLLDSLVGMFLGTILAAASRHWDWGLRPQEGVLQVLDIAENSFVAFLWVLILVAIFRGRHPEAASNGSAPATDRPADPT